VGTFLFPKKTKLAQGFGRNKKYRRLNGGKTFYFQAGAKWKSYANSAEVTKKIPITNNYWGFYLTSKPYTPFLAFVIIAF